jgi:hypothetical protein
MHLGGVTSAKLVPTGNIVPKPFANREPNISKYWTSDVRFEQVGGDLPSACRTANIALNHEMILSYDANPWMEFSERTGHSLTLSRLISVVCFVPIAEVAWR